MKKQNILKSFPIIVSVFTFLLFGTNQVFAQVVAPVGQNLGGFVTPITTSMNLCGSAVPPGTKVTGATTDFSTGITARTVDKATGAVINPPTLVIPQNSADKNGVMPSTSNGVTSNFTTPTTATQNLNTYTGTPAPGINLLMGPTCPGNTQSVLASITVTCKSTAASGSPVFQTIPTIIVNGSINNGQGAPLPAGCKEPQITMNFVDKNNLGAAGVDAPIGTLQIIPTSAKVAPGGSRQYNVIFTSGSTANQTVNFNFDSGCPPGSSCTFDDSGAGSSNPTSVAPGGVLNKVLTIATNVGTPLNTYPFQVSANNGSTVSAKLVVTNIVFPQDNHASFVKYEYSTDSGSTWSTTAPTLYTNQANVKARVTMLNDGTTDWHKNTGGALCPSNNGYYLHPDLATSGNINWGVSKVESASDPTPAQPSASYFTIHVTDPGAVVVAEVEAVDNTGGTLLPSDVVSAVYNYFDQAKADQLDIDDPANAPHNPNFTDILTPQQINDLLDGSTGTTYGVAGKTGNELRINTSRPFTLKRMAVLGTFWRDLNNNPQYGDVFQVTPDLSGGGYHAIYDAGGNPSWVILGTNNKTEQAFTFDIAAPSTAGTYGFGWRMYEECFTPSGFDNSSPKVNINVINPSFSVDLLINGKKSDSVFQNTPLANLTWTTTGSPTSCTASGSWSGAKAVGVGGPEDRSADTATTGLKTYTISCVKSGVPNVTKTDTVYLGVQPTPPCSNAGKVGANQFIGCSFTWDTNHGSLEAAPNAVPPLVQEFWDLQSNAPNGLTVAAASASATAINYNWSSANPPGLSTAQNYKMEWQGDFTFADGDYIFTNTSSDGAALFLDGGTNSFFDDWSDHTSRATSSPAIHLSAGVHRLFYVFYVHNGSGRVGLSWRVNGPPVVDIKGTAWADWVGTGRDVTYHFVNSDGPMLLYALEPFKLDWTSTDADSCALDGAAAATNGSNNTLSATPGSSFDHTYTLSCTGPGGTAQDTIRVLVPPMPTGLSVSCPAPGTTATLLWTLPAGYTTSYQRVYTPDGNGTPVYRNESFVGTSTTVSTLPNTSYSWWMHTEETTYGNWSQAAGINFTCAATVCPAGSVSVLPTSITVGNTSAASAPSGWSGGQFSSTNSAVASVSGSTLTGRASGAVQVTGSGWAAPNGATSCNLSGTNLTVTPVGGGAPTVTLTANPTSVSAGSASTLTWTISNATSCTSTGANAMPAGNWTTGGNGNASTGSLNSNANYTLSCSGPGGGPTTASAGVTVTGGGTPPPTVSLDNATCGVMKVTWSPVAGATSYNIYHNTTGAVPVIGTTVPNHVNVTSQYSDAMAAGSYSYWVTAVGPGGESAPQGPTSGTNSTAVSACGIGNLTTSDKDIISINGLTMTNPPPTDCNGTDSLPAATSFKLGDKVTFRINLCNKGTGDASVIKITDTLTNLQMRSDTGSWNMCYTTGTSCSTGTVTPITAGSGNNQYTESGASPNKVLTINISPTLPINGGGHLIFDAQLGVVSSFMGATSRFQNSFKIDYNQSPGSPVSTNGYTPLYLFSTGKGVPKIIEIP